MSDWTCKKLLQCLKWVVRQWLIFRSTLRQSRPNKAGLICPPVCPCGMYVRTFVHPQIVSSILMKFGVWVEVDE